MPNYLESISLLVILLRPTSRIWLNPYEISFPLAGVFQDDKQFKAEQDAEAAQLGTKWEDHDRLFTKWNGEPMNPQTPYGWFREFCKHNDFRFCDIHSLRHLHASLLIFEGVDVVAVSADMGHSIVGTTLNLYSHMFQEARTRNCDAITNALSFNNEPTGGSQDSAESEEAVDIDETDDEAEEETMSLSM